MVLFVVLDILIGLGLFVLGLNTPGKLLRWIAFAGAFIELVAAIMGLLK